jgi:uncharacterized membrane protein
MNRLVAAYLATAVAMIVLDLLWLGAIAKPLYQQGIGHLMAAQPRLAAAAAFYALYAMGLLVFVIAPQADAPGWGRTLAMGALFGLVAYATYDLSNLATLRDWPLRLALIDMAWGALLSAASAVAGRAAMQWASKS